ncbi:MAG: hypothetical protein ACFB6R_06460 [Alphaproteobacteria bacterium]
MRKDSLADPAETVETVNLGLTRIGDVLCAPAVDHGNVTGR